MLNLNDPVNVSRAQLDYVVDVERLRLEVVDRLTEIAVDMIAYQRLDTELGYLQDLAAKGVAVQMQLSDVQLKRDETKKRMEGNTTAIAEAKEQLQRAEQRYQELPQKLVTDGPETIDTEAIMAPLRAEVDTQEARIAALQRQIDLLDVRAPFAGRISEVYLWPNQHVRAGDPIVTLTKDDGDAAGKQYILSYLRQEQRIRPNKEAAVQVRLRMPGASAVAAKVAEVGPQFEPIPLRQLVDPARPEFGLPVRILVPKEIESKVRPGELVDVRFSR